MRPGATLDFRVRNATDKVYAKGVMTALIVPFLAKVRPELLSFS